MKMRWWDLLSGIGIAAPLVAKAWFGPKPEPLTTEERLAMLPCAGAPVDRRVEIRWNEQQIPFIEADSDEDLMVALGMVHAHLRLGQLEWMRRVSQGRLSECVGPLAVEMDRSLRLLDFGRAVPAILAMMSEDERRLAERFVAGLNHVLMNVQRLPLEMTLLRMPRQPWTVTDLLTLSRLASSDFIWSVFTTLLPLRERMQPAQWQELWRRLLDSGAPPEPARDTTSRVVAALARVGSNSLAVSARRAANGAPLIASDPHVGLGLPGAWIIVGMKSPGFHCVGLAMAGMPHILLGRNRSIAWGGTSLHAQSSDLYDVSAQSASFQARETLITIRGRRPRRVILRESEFGPVVSDGPQLACSRPLAMQWMGHRPSNEIGAMWGVARATDFESYLEALSGYGVSGANMIFAGSDGRVAHVLAAHLPKRPMEIPEDLVLPPLAAKHWQHIGDVRQMPIRLDPPQGFVASANDRPSDETFPAGYFYAPVDRIQRLRSLLAAPAVLDMETMRHIQRDVYAASSVRLRDLLLRHAAASAAGQELLAALRDWDGYYRADSTGALALELLLAGVASQLRKDGRLGAYQAVWNSHRLLLNDFQALPADELAKMIARGLPRAAKAWRRYRCWGEVHRIGAKHWLGALPGLGRHLNASPFAGEGASNTVCKTVAPLSLRPHQVSFGASARHVSDLSDLDANDFVVVGGQDGWPGSANYRDQLELWQRGEYIRVPMDPGKVRERFQHLSVLEPAAGGQ